MRRSIGVHEPPDRGASYEAGGTPGRTRTGFLAKVNDVGTCHGVIVPKGEALEPPPPIHVYRNVLSCRGRASVEECRPTQP